MIAPNDCDHDWEYDNYEHEEDDAPTGYNYSTEHIRYEVFSSHVGVKICFKCDKREDFKEDCDCGPE